KRLPWPPSQLRFNFAGIHRITPIMPWAILNKLNQLTMWNGRVAGSQLIQYGADRIHNIEILYFVPAADIISFPNSTPQQHRTNCFTVIADEQPVTYILPVAIYRYWLAAYGMKYHQRN